MSPFPDPLGDMVLLVFILPSASITGKWASAHIMVYYREMKMACGKDAIKAYKSRSEIPSLSQPTC